MITQRLVTLYTHQKLFANRRPSHRSYPRLYSRLVLFETPCTVPAFAFHAEHWIGFYIEQIVTESQGDAAVHITSLSSMGPQFS
jgi:hypothetical protein